MSLYQRLLRFSRSPTLPRAADTPPLHAAWTGHRCAEASPALRGSRAAAGVRGRWTTSCPAGPVANLPGKNYGDTHGTHADIIYIYMIIIYIYIYNLIDSPIFKDSVQWRVLPEAVKIWALESTGATGSSVDDLPCHLAPAGPCPCRLCSASGAVTRDTTNSPGVVPPFERGWNSPRLCFVMVSSPHWLIPYWYCKV